MKRPICIATIASMIGIIIGLYCNSIASFLCFILTISIFILTFLKTYPIFFMKNSKNKILLSKQPNMAIEVILLFCGFLLLFLCYTIYLENQYQKIYQEYDSQELEIQAIVLSNGEEKEYTIVYQVKVYQINGKKVQPIHFLLQIKKESIPLEYGQKIALQAMYQKPDVARNEGGFDNSSYLKTRQIAGTIFCNENDIQILTKFPKFSIGKVMQDIKIKIKQNLNQLFFKDVARTSFRTYYWRKEKY